MGGKATGGKRVKLYTAISIADRVIREFGGLYDRVAMAGSIRREKEEVGDIDLCFIPSPDPFNVEAFNSQLGGMFGWQKPKRKSDPLKPKRVGLFEEVQIDFYITTKESWGAMLMFCTGSPQMNIRQRQIASAKGYKLNEKGLWEGDKMIAGATEKEVYSALDMAFLNPKDRG